MLKRLQPIQWVLLLTLSAFLLVFIKINLDKTSANPQELALELKHFDVYKSPTCGCCGDWIEHFEESGFSTETHHPEDLAAVKIQQGIQGNYQSCHTTVSSNGYVFEGHIPAKFIRRFMLNPPTDAIGLTVPGMPLGSPGMEVEDRFTPYQILVLFKDGSNEVYAAINSYSEQF